MKRELPFASHSFSGMKLPFPFASSSVSLWNKKPPRMRKESSSTLELAGIFWHSGERHKRIAVGGKVSSQYEAATPALAASRASKHRVVRAPTHISH